MKVGKFYLFGRCYCCSLGIKIASKSSFFSMLIIKYTHIWIQDWKIAFGLMQVAVFSDIVLSLDYFFSTRNVKRELYEENIISKQCSRQVWYKEISFRMSSKVEEREKNSTVIFFVDTNESTKIFTEGKSNILHLWWCRAMLISTSSLPWHLPISEK